MTITEIRAADGHAVCALPNGTAFTIKIAELVVVDECACHLC